ncbi:MAG: hypothetical protein ACXAC5_05015 [Promethearchaeota archaeon]|jgi:hypothetical protein
MEKKWVKGFPSKIKLSDKDSSSMSKVMSGKVVDIIAGLEKALWQAEDLGYKNLRIEWGHHADGITCYDIVADRLETDEEFERRRKRKLEEEAKERALYEELKAKYE